MKERRKSYNRKNFVIALILLAAANVILGSVMLIQSRAAMRTQIDRRMLDISNTAAYMLNGDEMKALTADDRGGEEYEDALEILRNFQQNIALAYIYAINCEDDGSFTFSVDPTLDDPGDFGEPIVTTEALRTAANGTPAVDKKPYEDA